MVLLDGAGAVVVVLWVDGCAARVVGAMAGHSSCRNFALVAAHVEAMKHFLSATRAPTSANKLPG